MKNLHIAVAVIAVLTLGALATAEAQGKGRRDGVHKQRHTLLQHRARSRKFQHAIDRRQGRQHARIRQGWQSGSLNGKELSRLHRNQKRIGRMERRFGADGRYTRHERRLIEGQLDRSSKRIWRMKHNRHAWKPRYRTHRHFRRYDHRPRYHRRQIYHLYEQAPSHSFGLEIETGEFRFKVNKSG